MIRLAEQYHGMVCTDGSPCVVYQSVQPVARVALEVSGGGFVTFRVWAGGPAAYEAEFFAWQMPLIPASPWGQSVQAGVYVAF